MDKQITGRDNWVTVQGLRLHYEDWGNESAQPMLLLHGITGSAIGWDLFAQTLYDEYHILALDQPGHGDSDWLENAEDYTYERHVAAITDFVDALALENVILVGISMGGRNAWLYTLQHPEKVEKLVIIDVCPEVPTQRSEQRREWYEMLVKHDDFESPIHALAVLRFLWPLAPGNPQVALDRLERNMKKLPNGGLGWKYDRRIVKAPDEEFRPRRQMIDPEKNWEKLRLIQCPTLLIRGANSEVLTPEFAQRMLDTIPNCTYSEVPNAGHGVTADNPPGFEAAVREFLKS